MKLDNTTIRLLLHISEEGSIARGAEKMNLAIAAASKRLADIESQLGLKLFNRLPHGVKITEYGANLLLHISQIDTLMQRIECDALALNKGLEGRVVIGAPKSSIIQFLSKDLRKIKTKYPKIEIEIIEENSRIVQELLKNSIIDIGIYEKKSGFIDLLQHHYKSDSLVAFYNPSYFDFKNPSVSIEEISSFPIITLGKGSAVAHALDRAHRSIHKNMGEHFVVSGFDTMVSLAIHGLGIGFIPPNALSLFQPNPTLIFKNIEGDWHRRNYVLSFIEGRAHPYTLRNIVSEILGDSN